MKAIVKIDRQPDVVLHPGDECNITLPSVNIRLIAEADPSYVQDSTTFDGDHGATVMTHGSIYNIPHVHDDGDGRFSTVEF